MVCLLTDRDVDALDRIAQRLHDRGLLEDSETIRAVVRRSVGRHEVRGMLAAKIMHVTPQTVRTWVAEGILPGRIDEAGRVFVTTEALQPVTEIRSARLASPAPVRDYSDEEILAEIESHRAEAKRR